MEKPISVDREHLRYERATVRPSIDQVLKALVTTYGLKVEDLMRGKRGKDNEPRKVGMYLAKALCDLKLKEIAAQFGTGSYGTVGTLRSRLKDASGRKVSQICKQHSAKLPTRDLTA